MAHQKAINSEFQHLMNASFDKEMAEVGIFQLFINLGKNMIGLSLIYHMYANLHYEVWQILVFFLVLQISFSLTHPFMGGILQRLGLKHSIALRGFCTIIFYAGLTAFLSENFVSTLLWMFPVLLIRAVGINVSNLGYDIFLTYHLSKESKGSSLAWMQIAIMGAAMVAPLLGGLVTKFWGFDMVTYIGMFFMLVGSLVLYLTPDEKIKVPYTPSKLVKDSIFDTPKFLYMGEWGRVFFDCVLWVVWPLFLILILKDVVSMGLLIGISSGLAMGLAYFVGKKIDKGAGKPSKILKHGAARSTILNFFRAIWLEPFVILGVDCLSKVNDQSIKVPYDIEFYRWMHEKNTFERAHIRRMIAENFYTVPLLIFALLFWFFSEAPVWLFVSIFGIGALCLSLTAQIPKINER